MYIIDRITDGVAVLELENNRHINVPLAALYSGAKEGDVVIMQASKYVFDAEQTAKLRAKNVALQNELFS